MHYARRPSRTTAYRRRPKIASLALFSAGLLSAGAVWADAQDSLQLAISSTLSIDNNLFRQSASAPDNGPRDERLTSTQISAKFERDYGQQHLKLSASLADNQYAKHDYLDFVGKNYNATLQWVAGPRLKGTLSADRSEALTSFSAFNIANTRNIRTQETRQLRAELDLIAGWALIGGLTESRLRNSSSTFTLDPDRNELSPEIGIRQNRPNGGFVEFSHKESNGEYVSRSSPDPALLLDTGYSQSENSLSMGWPLSKKSRLQGKVAHLARRYDHYSERNYSGTVLQLDYAWQATEKLALAATYRQGLEAYTATDSSYYQSETLSLAPVWQLTPKTAARLTLLREKRGYRGNPAPLTVDREDTLDLYGLALDWTPLSALQLSAAVQHEKRESNVSGQDFKARVSQITANLRF